MSIEQMTTTETQEITELHGEYSVILCVLRASVVKNSQLNETPGKNIIKRLYFVLILCLIGSNTNAQTDTTCHHKKCAVVLTHSDGLNAHLFNAIPALDLVGLKGTFYIS